MENDQPGSAGTGADYRQLVETCLSLFVAKNREYGPTWLLLRPFAIIDHILIKAVRVRTIESPGHVQKISDSVEYDLLGIANYCAMGICRAETDRTFSSARSASSDPLQAEETWLVDLMRNTYERSGELMSRKNSDYGEVWRLMEPESFTDEIILRTHRMKKIIRGLDEISFEPIIEQLMDTLNYAFFSVLRRRQSR